MRMPDFMIDSHTHINGYKTRTVHLQNFRVYQKFIFDAVSSDSKIQGWERREKMNLRCVASADDGVDPHVF